MHALHFGVRTRGQNRKEHQHPSEAEMKFRFKLQFSITLLLAVLFSSLADQNFCLLCRQHLSNVNKEEVMAAVKETQLCSSIKSPHFNQSEWHSEWGMCAAHVALRRLLKPISIHSHSSSFHCNIRNSLYLPPVSSDLKMCLIWDEEKRVRRSSSDSLSS